MRNYKRKTQRWKINEEKIEEALTDIRLNKLTVKEASTKHGISYCSLMFRKKRAMAAMGGEWEDPVVPTRMGLKTRDSVSKHSSRQVFSCTEEDQLAEYLLKSSKLNYGLTIDVTQKLAYFYAVFLHRNFPESWERDKKAGKDWARGFVKRHRQISLRKPENTSLARNVSFNRESLTAYFDNPQTLIQQHAFEPSRGVHPLDRSKLFKDVESKENTPGKTSAAKSQVSLDASTASANLFQISFETSAVAINEEYDLTMPSYSHELPPEVNLELIPMRSSSPYGEEEPLDLTVRHKDNIYEVQMTCKRPQSMIDGPLDLTRPSISYNHLRFGGLEIIRPLPNPLAFQNTPKINRQGCSTIMTGSSEIGGAEHGEGSGRMQDLKENLKKEKSCKKTEQNKVEPEVPKRKRGRPRKTPLCENIGKEQKNI